MECTCLFGGKPVSLCESRDRDLCGDRCVRPIRTDPGSLAACASPFLPQVTHDTAPVTSPDGQLALTLSGVGSKESGVGGGCCPGAGLITRRRLPGCRAYQVSATWGGGRCSVLMLSQDTQPTLVCMSRAAGSQGERFPLCAAAGGGGAGGPWHLVSAYTCPSQ